MLVGIDLGTTHSLIGVWTPKGPSLIANALGDVLTPSVVGCDDDGQMLVGQAARELLYTRSSHAVASFKRHMGTRSRLNLGTRSMLPEELSALVLKSLIADAEAATGERVSEAIISVPAYFSDAQRKATRRAGELAGIKVERLINEPTAAALAYGLEQRDAEARFLIFDLGGGTFDVSILQTFDGVMEVHASAGDNFLGGEDFVQVLAELCYADLQLKPDDVNNGRLLQYLERAKRQLSQQESVTVTIESAAGSQPWTITQQRFEAACEGLLARMRGPIERALRDAKLRSTDLDEVVLVGGATRMPMVARMMTRLLGRLPLRHLSPDEVIAHGACALAGLKQRSLDLKEVVLTDVCPYSLGVEVSQHGPSGQVLDGFFSPIIERNQTVPLSRVQSYLPMRDDQKQINLRIYQGESVRVSNNILLGQLDVPIPGGAREQNQVDVRFTYDINGLLEVDATHIRSGKNHQLVLTQGADLSEREWSEIRARLSELKIHPRQVQANQALMHRAERLHEEHLGDVRQQIAHWIATFTAVLDSQDPPAIEKARREFKAALDQVEVSSPWTT